GRVDELARETPHRRAQAAAQRLIVTHEPVRLALRAVLRELRRAARIGRGSAGARRSAARGLSGCSRRSAGVRAALCGAAHARTWLATVTRSRSSLARLGAAARARAAGLWRAAGLCRAAG